MQAQAAHGTRIGFKAIGGRTAINKVGPQLIFNQIQNGLRKDGNTDQQIKEIKIETIEISNTLLHGILSKKEMHAATTKADVMVTFASNHFMFIRAEAFH